MAQALYREWRPLTWSEIVGQEHVVRTLQNAVKAERLSHAYLFSGPRGTGKTSTARILAKAVNCLAESLANRPCNECRACVAVNEGRYLDLIEIDAASNTSVDDVRDLRDRINFAPNEGRFKVYIVDEVHMLSTAAFNALLKTLEEPPAHAIFVLATTEVHKVPATVLSRCQRHEFRRIPVDEITRYLEEKNEEGGYEVEPEALALISRQATGSLRDAVSLLDQLLSMGEAVTLEQAQEVLGTAMDEAVGDLVQAIADRDAAAGLELINKAIDGGIDPRQFARQIVEWLRILLLITAGDAHDERMVAQAESIGTRAILQAMHAFSKATRGERTAWQPGLALELAFMDSFDTAPSDAAREAPKDDAPPDAEEDAGSKAADDAPSGATSDPPKIVKERPRSSDSGSEFQRVLDAWPELLAAAYGRDPQTQALLNSCKPLGVDDHSLVLGFQSDLLREKMEKGHNRQIVSDALGEVLDAELNVRCVLLQTEASTAPTLPLPEGGMVAAALRDLGAEVVDYGPEVEMEDAGADEEQSSQENKDEEER